MLSALNLRFAGFDESGEYKRENPVGQAYIKSSTLSVITGASLLIAGAGVFVYLIGMKHFPAAAAFMHLNSVPPHALWIGSVAAMSAGGSSAVIHGTMLGLYKNGERIAIDRRYHTV